MIYHAIKHLFPGIRDHEFMLQDDSDGRGPYIGQWHRPEPKPTMAQIEAAYPQAQAALLQGEVVAAVQKRLDDFAKTRGYDDIKSACSYATSKRPRYRAESECCVDARDAHWDKCYEILARAQAGEIAPENLTVEWIVGQMPTLKWPSA